MPFHRPLLAAAILLAPISAHAASLGLTDVVANAAPVQKLILLGIVAATVAGVVVGGLKLAAGPRLAGGSAFLSSLRLGGPIAGILGAAYAALKMSAGIAAIPYEPTLKVLAPGFAEIAALIALGFLSGVIAVALNWAIEARIDRQVLAG